MATRTTQIAAPLEHVAELLSDPKVYEGWVVGGGEITTSDDDFPAPHSRFAHRHAIGPVGFEDETEVLENELPRRLVLRAKAPFGDADIAIDLRRAGRGTRMTLAETPSSPIASAVHNPVADALIAIRNDESLRRFRRIAEGKAPRPEPPRILITGGSSGIGLATARELAGDGARLALIARGTDGLERAAADLRERGAAEVSTFPADVSDRAIAEAAVTEAAAALGGLDAVVAAAGAAAFGPFRDTDPADFDRNVETVFGGVVATTRAALPHLAESDGTLVLIGSVLGEIPQPGLAAYSAAKHAVTGFAHSLRGELEEADSGVSVCLVKPGTVNTPIFENATGERGHVSEVPPGAYRPEVVAKTIAVCIDNPVDEVTIGGETRLGEAGWALLRPVARAALSLVVRITRGEGGQSRPATGGGAVREPRGSGRVEGDGNGRPSAVEPLARRLRTMPGVGALTRIAP